MMRWQSQKLRFVTTKLLPVPVSHQTTQKSDSQQNKASIEKERIRKSDDENHQERAAIRATILKTFHCKLHSHGDKTLLCWKDPTDSNQLCYLITEQNINLWTMLCVRTFPDFTMLFQF